MFWIISKNNYLRSASSIPATLNLEEPIESGNIKLIAKEPLKEKASIALSNSFGFGGTNTALLFKSI